MRIILEKKKGVFTAPALMIMMTLAFILMILRRPDIVTHAQPWAEDGAAWMAQAYNYGFWKSLIIAHSGYYQTVSRLTFSIALIFGISKAALVANLIAMLIRCFFIGFILSSRMNFIHIGYRIAIALYILLMPGISEAYVNITNAQWYLSLYMLAVVMASAPVDTKNNIHDYLVMIIGGLSGPFALFVAPCLIIKRISERGGFLKAIKGINMFDVTLAACCIIQIFGIVTTAGTARQIVSEGTSLGLLANIVSCRIIFSAFLPFDLAKAMAAHDHVNMVLFLILSVSLIAAFFKFGWRIKALILFPIFVFASALISQLGSSGQSMWPILYHTDGAQRYFIATNICLACLAIILISTLNKFRTTIAVAATVFFIYFTPLYFTFPAINDSGYYQDLESFESLAPGKMAEIRIPPNWKMVLQKK